MESTLRAYTKVYTEPLGSRACAQILPYIHNCRRKTVMRKKRSGPGGTGGRMGRRAACLAALSLFCACDPMSKVSPDTAALTAMTPGSVPAEPDCASCHAYPLHDVNHQYHLISAN